MSDEDLAVLVRQAEDAVHADDVLPTSLTRQLLDLRAKAVNDPELLGRIDRLIKGEY